MSAPEVPKGLAAYIGVVQFFFVTTWTVYVIYLPALAQQAGLAIVAGRSIIQGPKRG